MLDLERARAIVERHFRVYEAREERVQGDAVAHLFFLMFPPEEFDARFEALRAELKAVDPELLVFVRREGGEDILFVAERPPVPPRRLGVHALLLGLTILTTMSAGALFWGGYRGDGAPGWDVLIEPLPLLWGFVTFALPLLLILGIHEMAHGIAARRHGLRATLPFFLPMPPFIFPIGTLGAFISLRDPLPDRRALFDVGASGPLAGFLVAIPVVVAGAWLTGVVAEPVPDIDRPDVILEEGLAGDVTQPGTGRTDVRILDPAPGAAIVQITSSADDWTYQAVATVTTEGNTTTETIGGDLAEGETRRFLLILPEGVETAEVAVTWDDGLIGFGDPLLVKGLQAVGLGGDEHLMHPTFFAGWVGLLVTGINLLPVGQLDGGHVARAVFGERMRYVAYGVVGLLMMLVFVFQSWLLIALFVLIFGLQHPPPLNDRTPLDRKRVVAAVLVLIVFAVTFVPRPFIF